MKSKNQQIMEENYRLRDEVINKVSPTFCLAKWLQSTLYLWNGYTHSCHHPSAHKIDPASLNDPKNLHNTPIKFYAREEMLKGIQTNECQYCWNIENNGPAHLSDRIYKSISPWAMDHFKEVTESGLGENINPTYLEVAFENTCNFKCIYCTPDVSSKWTEEIERSGPYDLNGYKMHDLTWLKSTGRFPIRRDEHNPYVEAFWKWWPDLIDSLEVFRITGGEPLLSKHTWKVLDYLIDNPKPSLELAINTNLNVPDKLINKLIDYLAKLEGKVKKIDIYTSLEATGPQAEYIRFGLNYQEFVENVRYFLSNTKKEQRLHFMVAMNNLSVTTFDKFLDLIWKLRCEFNDNDAENRIPMMINYIRWPQFLNVRILPEKVKTKYEKIWKDYAYAHMRNTSPSKAGRLYLEEIDQIERLCEYMLGADSNEENLIRQFNAYINEYDSRRKVSFDDIFPELIDLTNAKA